MTKHNLEEHLSWLLGSKPFAPPPARPTPPGEPSPLIPDIEADLQESVIHDTRIQGDNVQSQRITDSAQLPLPSRHWNSGGTETMARLQSGPRSTTKPRLLSRISPDPLQTPAPYTSRVSGNSLRDQYSAAYEQSKHGKPNLDTRTEQYTYLTINAITFKTHIGVP